MRVKPCLKNLGAFIVGLGLWLVLAYGVVIVLRFALCSTLSYKETTHA